MDRMSLISGGNKVEEELMVNEETANTDGLEEEIQDFGALLDATPQRLEEGMIIRARVVLVQDDAVYVDLGWKSDLPVKLSELTTKPAASASEVVKPGDEIQVMVVASRDQDEPFMLSKNRADQELVWSRLNEELAQGKAVTGRASRVVKGGLEMNVEGVRAFLPASQVELGYTKDLEPYVGKKFTCVISELDPARKRMVLSRRTILEQEKAQAEERVYTQIEAGAKVKVKVTRTMPFGAFVDLGEGVEGLIHLSELSWERVNNANAVVQPGEEIEALVIKVDREDKRISLSLKQLRPHPWDQVLSRFHEGDTVEGTVVRLAQFGAFVNLAEGVDGLVHISQLAHERVKNVKDVVKEGQKVQVKVLAIDPEHRRISLSLKATSLPPAVAATSEDATKEPSEAEEIQSYLKNQETGELCSSLADLFEQKK
jgi:small subunit ribosomal protein S1